MQNLFYIEKLEIVYKVEMIVRDFFMLYSVTIVKKTEYFGRFVRRKEIGSGHRKHVQGQHIYHFARKRQ